jgi:membrane protein implicated in regulation of membrane protease activity
MTVSEGFLVEWLEHILFWHWWVLAGMLLILELTSPVFFFLWLSFSAVAVGFGLMIFPNIPAKMQLLLFAILSVVTVIGWRKYRSRQP